MPLHKIIFIIGPTAVGKSDVALALARQIKGEIISCDSMQVYREVDIVNNKPSLEARREVPHHLVDIISVREEFDVARFNALALEAIEGIHAKGGIPIVAGGSGMYMQVLLDGIFEGCVKDEPLRRELKAQAQRCGNEFLYDKLKIADPEAAAGIHPHDLRRIIRALEVCRTADGQISKLRKNRNGLWGRYDITAIALGMDREELYGRINRRVEEMFQQGVVEEIRKLAGVPLSLTAGRIIGVREIQGYCQGAYDEARARELMKLNTRRLAKRQMTWFRKEKRLRWITVKKDDTVEDVVSAVLS
jgi:tRNA dimethylallyltransferase